MRKPRISVVSLLILIAVALLLIACGLTTPIATAPAPTSPPTALPPTKPPATSRGRCGDGVCDGPENAQNCPQDCAETTATSVPTSAPGQTAEALGARDESACRNPNPHRAVVTEELLDFYNSLADGGFEEGEAEVVIADHHLETLERATVERVSETARTGSYGYAVTAGPGEGITFSIKAYIEKGEDTRYSIWVRSPDGEVTLQPLVYWVMLDLSPGASPEEGELGQPFRADPVTVGPEWTQVRFVVENTKGIRCALFSFEVGPNTTLHLDDAQVESRLWRMAEYDGPSRTVGGILVPAEPVAPVHISFLIHIEDPSLMQANETFFQMKSVIFREVARIFYEHGGFLTIQPEQDWPMAAEAGFHPGLLAELVEDYNVHYSTHTHGPKCRDDRGLLRSAGDCNAHPEWDKNFDDDDVIEYVRNLSDLITDASGTSVTDHNGNFEFTQASRYAEIPMLTWSAYKNHNIQRTYDRLINNPWRPGEGNANADVENFMTHHPETDIVYIPGWGQALTRHHGRVLTRLRPLVSQFIRFADPDRVNTFYAILHVDHFHSREGNRDYIAYDEATGEITYSDEFKQHLQYWDDMLTELIDPLVEEGYLQWTSLPEMGELYLEWEAACVALQEITVPADTSTEALSPTQTASLQGVTAPANTPIEMSSPVVVPANLCREAEQIVFSCQIKGSDKILSVCAAQNLDRENGYLQYRFGTNKEVELEFPSDIRDSQKAFRYSRYTRPLVTYLRLSFQENNYTFTVYDDYTAETGTEHRCAGVTVVSPDGKQTDFECETPIISNLMLLEYIVPKGE